MTTKAKAVNYTDEQVATMTSMYKGVDNKAEVQAIADAIGKSPSSVVSKLGQLKVYIKATKTVVGKGRNKDAIAADIASYANLTELETEGLTKATKGALVKVLDTLAEMSDEAETEGEAETE